MKKRIFSLLIALCLMVGLLPAVAYAAEEPALPEADVEKLGATAYTGEYYSYDLVGDRELTSHNGTLGMQIAMKFTAKDSAEEAAAHHYADYTTDFYIEINGLANGEAIGNGCYLAGYYEAYGMWVKIPLDGFKIENGKVYPVITSAGFDFDYAAICSEVKSFTCGIYFSKEFLDANPGVEVNLSMGLSETYEKAIASDFITVEEYAYTAADLKALPEAIVEKLGATTYTGEYYSYDLVGDRELTSHNGDIDMQIAMKFTAKDSAEQAAAHYYADYTTDFYIEINGLANGEAIGNGCYLAGYYEAYGMWVKIPLDGFKIENGKVYPVITSAGFDFDYAAICKDVQSFTCGIYFSEEFLAANPGIEVTLSMGLSETYEQAIASEFITVEEYVYDEADLKGEHIHTEEIIPGKEATCTETGLTAGVKCAECGEILTAQEEIPVLSHTFDGVTDTDCNVCGFTREVDKFELSGKKIVITEGESIQDLTTLFVFYIGDQDAKDIYNFPHLKELGLKAGRNPAGYRAYHGKEKVDAVRLQDEGNYVLLMQYKDMDGKNSYYSEQVSVKNLPIISVDEFKPSVDMRIPENTFQEMFVFYVGQETPTDLYTFSTLQETGKKYSDVNGGSGYKSYKYVNSFNSSVTLPEEGNYVLLLRYLEPNGTVQYESKLVTVEINPQVSLNGNKVVVDERVDTNVVTQIQVFYVGDSAIKDMYSFGELKNTGLKYDVYPSGYKSFSGANLQYAKVAGAEGDYVILVKYTNVFGDTSNYVSERLTYTAG